MTDKVRELTVDSEKTAFELLERAINHELGDQPFVLKFDNWPVIQIRLEGTGYDSTITSDMAAALVEIQHALNRAYARTAHLATNARHLTADERQQIQFKAKVGKGSSLIDINLGEMAEKLALGVMDKMGPESIVITVLGLGISAAATVVYKSFLKQRSEEKKLTIEAERAIALSQEETRRLEIFERAVKSHPSLNHIRQDFDEARHEIVRGTSDATSLTVGDVTIDRDSARVISLTKRSESKELQLNGNYYIRRVDWQVDGEVRLTVANVDSVRVFNATYRDDSKNREQTELLKTAEWERSKVYLSINASELRGEITKAIIIGVKVQPDEKEVSGTHAAGD